MSWMVWMTGLQVDDSITVAGIAGFFSLATAIVGSVVAVVVNRSEKKQTATATLEKAYEQRLLLRDEKIAELEEDLMEANQKLAEAEK